MARVLEPSAADLLFLTDATVGGTGGRQAAPGSKKKGAFTCELRQGNGVMKIAFAELIGWLDVREKDIHPWTGMESLCFAGAFRLPEESRPVMVVDVDRLIDGHPDRLARGIASHGDNMAGGNGVMHGDKKEWLVKIRAGKAWAALPLSSLYMIYSVRRAKIHLISATNRMVTGLLERDGEFLTVVDLGLLLSIEATGTRPENRLLDVRTMGGRIALLAEQIFEPVEVKPEDMVAKEPAGAEAAESGFVESVWRQEEGAPIPVLNLNHLVLSLKNPVSDGK
ncbi:MAG: chemotaxis protein CheW [Proteobacteria bacterium]|nr:chemotaxis protein CheW [Pseudomonadota bacterium]